MAVPTNLGKRRHWQRDPSRLPSRRQRGLWLR